MYKIMKSFMCVVLCFTLIFISAPITTQAGVGTDWYFEDFSESISSTSSYNSNTWYLQATSGQGSIGITPEQKLELIRTGTSGGVNATYTMLSAITVGKVAVEFKFYMNGTEDKTTQFNLKNSAGEDIAIYQFRQNSGIFARRKSEATYDKLNNKVSLAKGDEVHFKAVINVGVDDDTNIQTYVNGELSSITRGFMPNTVNIGRLFYTLTGTHNGGGIVIDDVKIYKIPSDAESVVNSCAELAIPDDVTSDLNLITNDVSNVTTISWSSSNLEIISNAGVVTRPADEDISVVLTAIVSKGTVSDIKRFIVNVIKVSDEEAVANAKEALDLGDLSEVELDISLPQFGMHGTIINWSSNNIEVISTNGLVIRPTDSDVDVTLTALISKGNESDTKTFIATVKKKEINDLKDVNNSKAALDLGNLSAVVSDIVLPLEDLANGTTISWVSENIEVISNTGHVTRGRSDVTVILTATITKGIESDTKVFVATVIGTDLQDVANDKANLTLVDISAVISNITLQQLGDNGSIITWSSNNLEVISNTGIVRRPTDGDTKVILTATITKGSVSETKTFTATVIAEIVEKILYLEDFSSSLNSFWSIGNSGGSVEVNSNTKKLEITRPIESTTGSATALYTLPGVVGNGKLTVEFELHMNGTDGKMVQFHLRNSANTSEQDLAVYQFRQNGGIFLRRTEGTLYDNVNSNIMLEKGETVHFKVIIDLDATDGTNIHTYVNSELSSIKRGFAATATPINLSKTYFIIPTTNNGGAIVIDNFKVSEMFPYKLYINQEEPAVYYIPLRSVPETYQLPNAVLKDKEGNILTDSQKTGVAWSIQGNVSGVSINNNTGEITINNTSTQQNIVLQCTSTYSDKIYQNIVVSLSPRQQVYYDVLDTKEKLADLVFIGKNNDMDEVLYDLKLPITDINGTTITWNSNSDALLIDGIENATMQTDGTYVVAGKIKREDYNQNVTLSAIVTKDAITITKEFNIIIYKTLTDQETISRDAIWLDIGNISRITDNLTFPTEGKFGSVISWYSERPNVISIDGKVNRPANESSSSVVVIATIIKENETTTKKFIVTVEPLYNTTGGGGSGGGGGTVITMPAPVKDVQTPNYILPNKVKFRDLDTVPWAIDYIEQLSDNGIISGVGEDLFDPDRNISREEFVALIVRALNLEYSSETTPFTDVDTTSWYYTPVAISAKLGIVNGIGYGLFGVGRPITREEMAAIILRALSVSGVTIQLEETPEAFEDDKDIASYVKEAVYTLRSAGIINGMDNNNYNPKYGATRAQAAKVVWFLYKIKQDL